MSAEEDVTGQLMEMLEAMAPARDAVDGYRADMLARGYSPTAAEAMALEFHRHLLNAAFAQHQGNRS